MKTFLLIAITWFITGFLTTIIMIADDIRGEEFDENYFDSDFFKIYAVAILIGYASPLIYLFIKFRDKITELNRNFDREAFGIKFGKFMYKLVNIGYKPNIVLRGNLAPSDQIEIECPKCGKRLSIEDRYYEDGFEKLLCHCEECLDGVDSDWLATLATDGNIEVKRYFFG